MKKRSTSGRLWIPFWTAALVWGCWSQTSLSGAGITPEDVAKLQSVASVAISPDGQRVAYVLSVPRRPGIDEDGSGWSELWLRHFSESEARPFLTGKVSVQQVSWSEDGRFLYFLTKSGDDKVRSLYRMPFDGGEARKVVELETDIGSYEWSSDGSRLALLALEPEAEGRKKLKEKGFKQQIYEEDWRRTRLWLWSSATESGEEREARALEIQGSVRGMAWHPDGQRLAVSLTPTPSVDDGMMYQQLVVLAANSAEESGRVDRQGKLGRFAWSPEGQFLAMIAAENINDPSAGRLQVVPASGGRPRDLIPGFLGEVREFAWLDDRELLFLAAVGTRSVLGRVRVSAEGGRSDYSLREWERPLVLSGLDLSKDRSKIAVLGHSPEFPSEVFTTEVESGSWERWTDSNPWLADREFAVQEVIRHSARDGLVLEGILIRPLNQEFGKRYPLILSVHGGPEAHVSHGWVTSYSLPGQVAAARGFAVFYPNYRGSTGRGVDFSKLGQGDAAGKEFDDLVDAVDHLIDLGLVDKERVGVTGGSYGGYATAWCSTRYSERFAAGVMFVGISDKISKVGTTDIADEEYHVHALKRPWEDWQFLLERSPIYHAGKSRTPLLILHGADDPRVHVSQSMEMHRHMKIRSQAPVRLVLYPGEEHGNRMAAARYDYNLRMLRWFEHFLIRGGTTAPDWSIDYAVEKE